MANTGRHGLMYDEYGWGDELNDQEQGRLAWGQDYRSKLGAIHQDERAAAMARYAQAGQEAELAGTMATNQAMRGAAGYRGLAGRNAAQSAVGNYAQTALGTGQAAQESRGAAVRSAMEVEAKRALYEEAAIQSALARLAAKNQTDYEKSQTINKYATLANDREMRLYGQMAGALSMGMAGMKGGG